MVNLGHLGGHVRGDMARGALCRRRASQIDHLVGNAYTLVTKCRTYEDGKSLEPHNNLARVPRSDAFLRAVGRTKMVGDCAHCAAWLCNAIGKGLVIDLSAWVAEGDGRGVLEHMQQVW